MAATSSHLMMSSRAWATRVLIVEDHDLLAQSLLFALTAEGYDAALWPVARLDGLIEEARTACPDVLLLDLDLGDAGDGSSMVGPLTALGIQVLVVSGTTDDMRLAAAIEAGAVGFIGKGQSFDRLMAAIADAAALQSVLAPGHREALLAALRADRYRRTVALAPFTSLTPREAEVLAAVIEGRRAEAIARSAFLSEATVRTHVRAILQKLGVTSQLEAVALARRIGWAGAAG